MACFEPGSDKDEILQSERSPSELAGPGNRKKKNKGKYFYWNSIKKLLDFLYFFTFFIKVSKILILLNNLFLSSIDTIAGAG